MVDDPGTERGMRWLFSGYRTRARGPSITGLRIWGDGDPDVHRLAAGDASQPLISTGP